jgi:hypothetical protein
MSFVYAKEAEIAIRDYQQRKRQGCVRERYVYVSRSESQEGTAGTCSNCKARCEKLKKICKNGRGCRHAKFGGASRNKHVKKVGGSAKAIRSQEGRGCRHAKFAEEEEEVEEE